MILEEQTYNNQFGFQFKFAEGRILNVGCNTDGARLRELKGAVNLDVTKRDRFTGADLPVDVIGDARALAYTGEFDTVVLGELLEHMTPADAVLSLQQAKKALKADGRIVITMPHDRRPNPEPSLEYARDVSFFHRNFTRADLLDWVLSAGLTVERLANIEYIWGEKGTGLVCMKGNVN